MARARASRTPLGLRHRVQPRARTHDVQSGTAGAGELARRRTKVARVNPVDRGAQLGFERRQSRRARTSSTTGSLGTLEEDVRHLHRVRSGPERRQRVDESLEPVLRLDDLVRRMLLETVRLVVDDERRGRPTARTASSRPWRRTPSCSNAKPSSGRTPSSRRAAAPASGELVPRGDERLDPSQIVLGRRRVAGQHAVADLLRLAHRPRAGRGPHRRSPSPRARPRAPAPRPAPSAGRQPDDPLGEEPVRAAVEERQRAVRETAHTVARRLRAGGRSSGSVGAIRAEPDSSATNSSSCAAPLAPGGLERRPAPPTPPRPRRRRSTRRSDAGVVPRSSSTGSASASPRPTLQTLAGARRAAPARRGGSTGRLRRRRSAGRSPASSPRREGAGSRPRRPRARPPSRRRTRRPPPPARSPGSRSGSRSARPAGRGSRPETVQERRARVCEHDDLELEPLGRVDGQEPDGVAALLLGDRLDLLAPRRPPGRGGSARSPRCPARGAPRTTARGARACGGSRSGAGRPSGPARPGRSRARRGSARRAARARAARPPSRAGRIAGETPRRAAGRARRATSGSSRSSPTKSGRRPAARRRRTSASFETPTKGDASTVTSASSS